MTTLAARRMEDRRRQGLGLDLLRPATRPHLLRHRQPGPVEPRAAAGRQQVDVRASSRATRHRRGRLVLPDGARTTCTTTTASTRTCCSTCRSAARTRKVLRAPRAQRLRLRAGPRDRRGARRPTPFVPRHRPRAASTSKTGTLRLRTRRRSRRLGQGRRATSARPRPAARTGSPRRGRRARSCSTSRTRTCARTTRASRRATSPARPTSAPNVKMYAGPGRPAAASFTAWDPVARKKAWAIDEKLPGVERRAGHRRRRRLLRHDGRLVQGGRCAGPASCSGSSRRARGIIGQPITLPRARRQAVRRRAVRRRRLGRRDRLRRPRHRATRPPARGLRQRDEGPAAAHARRAACCMSSRLPVSDARCAAMLLVARARRWLACVACAGTDVRADAARTLRVCADPDNLPFSNERRQRLREPHRASSSPTSCRRALRLHMAAAARGFVRKTLGADLCDVLIGVPSGFERVLTTRALLPLELRLRDAADGAAPLASFDDPRLRAAAHRRAAGRQRLAATPPGHALARAGAIDNVVGYTGLRRRARRPSGWSTRSPQGALDAALRLGAAGRLLRDACGACRCSCASRRAAARASSRAVRVRDRDGRAPRRRGAARRARRRASSAAAREIDAILAHYGVPRSDRQRRGVATP